MAVFNSVLNSRAWIDADDLAEWLFDDKPERVAVPPAALNAFLVAQFIRFTAQNEGVLGNNISIQFVGGAVKGAEVVTVTGESIEVQIEDGVSTTEDVRAAISASGLASGLVSVQLEVNEPDTLPDVEIRTVNLQTVTNLQNGADDVPFPKSDVPFRRRRFEQLINAATSKIEQILRTNVLQREYREELDGNDSNVVVPSQWPITNITDLRIDFNRNFDPSSIVEEINIILRGATDVRADFPNNDLRIVGNDIYLRDDDNDNVIGRIFSGSVAGSVQITYTAGWARDIDDVPSELRLAALQLVEWFEYRRSNRDVGIASKGVRGESYSKAGELCDGIPIEIYELIQQYINHSFGLFERHQNNIFGV